MLGKRRPDARISAGNLASVLRDQGGGRDASTTKLGFCIRQRTSSRYKRVLILYPLFVYGSSFQFILTKFICFAITAINDLPFLCHKGKF